MGQAFDGDGNVLGEASGDTKREVFEKLTAAHADAAEIRIRSQARDEVPRTTPLNPREKLAQIFKYHAPTPDDTVAYEKLRSSAKDFATAIIELTPPCADQSAAIRHVREAVMTANAAIALHGLV